MSLVVGRVIVSGLAIGYWLVGAFLSPPADSAHSDRTTPGDDATDDTSKPST
jgi:hypothetical protein